MPVLAAAVDFAITIGGQPVRVRPGWSIDAPVNGRATLSCAITSLDGTWRPALDQTVLVTVNGGDIFGGDIQEVEERGLNDAGLPPISTHISAIDYNALTDRRLINQPLNEGSLKEVLEQIAQLLLQIGVTIHPAQPDGPHIPALAFNFATMTTVLEELAQITGYAHEINATRQLIMYPPNSRPAPFNIAPGDGHVIGDLTVQHTRAGAGSAYANSIYVWGGPTGAEPVYAYAESIPEISAHGLWMTVLRAETITDQATADALAVAAVAERAQRPKTATYVTHTPGLVPGMTQTIYEPTRNLDNLFLITNVRTYDKTNRVQYLVTATESAVVPKTWIDQFQIWFSGSLQSIAVGTPAGGGGGTALIPVIWLGGSDTSLVQSPTAAAWIPASARRAWQTLIEAGTTPNRTVVARMRATAGTVTARLQNISDNVGAGGVTVGVSAPVGTTAFQTVTFPVTLTAGSKVYEVQLQPSLAATDVALGSCYLQ